MNQRCRSNVIVSFRGSLAAEAASHIADATNPERAAAEYVQRLLATGNPDLVQLPDQERLVLGLKSERGHFPPDW
jgi:hypothetical protein